MPYTYSKKSFARDLFDAAKARLQKPMPKFFDRSAQWPGIIHYGVHRPLLSYWIQFRSVQGSRLHTNSVPLCSYAPEFIASLSRKNLTPPPQADLDAEFAERVAAMKAAEAFGNGLSFANSDGALGPSFENESQADSDETQAPVSSSRKIPTAVLSTFLSVAAAIAGGVIIANSNTFKVQHAATNSPPPAEAPAHTDRLAAGEPASARLALAPTLPQSSRSFPAVSESKSESKSEAKSEAKSASRSASRPGPQPSSEKKSETRSKEVQAGVKNLRKTDTESRPPRRVAAAEPSVKPKKTARNDGSNTSRPAPIVAAKTDRPLHARQSNSHAGTQYAKCDSIKGLLQRERCKWNACGDKWGKQGCPAYRHNARPELGYGQLGQSDPAAESRTLDGG